MMRKGTQYVFGASVAKNHILIAPFNTEVLKKKDLAGNKAIFDWLYRKKAHLKSRATFRGVAGPVADLGGNLPKWKVVGAVQMLCVDGKGVRIGSGHCVVGKVTVDQSVVRRPLLQVWVGEMGVGDGMKIYCEPVKFAGRYVKEVIAEWGEDAYVGRGRQRWFGKLPSEYDDNQFETEPTGDDNSPD